jgi:hypothetical protein
MTEETMLLIVYLVIITLLAILVFVINLGRLFICELRRTFDQILAGTRSIEPVLEHQRSSATSGGARQVAKYGF